MLNLIKKRLHALKLPLIPDLLNEMQCQFFSINIIIEIQNIGLDIWAFLLFKSRSEANIRDPQQGAFG